MRNDWFWNLGILANLRPVCDTVEKISRGVACEIIGSFSQVKYYKSRRLVGIVHPIKRNQKLHLISPSPWRQQNNRYITEITLVMSFLYGHAVPSWIEVTFTVISWTLGWGKVLWFHNTETRHLSLISFLFLLHFKAGVEHRKLTSVNLKSLVSGGSWFSARLVSGVLKSKSRPLPTYRQPHRKNCKLDGRSLAAEESCRLGLEVGDARWPFLFKHLKGLTCRAARTSPGHVAGFLFWASSFSWRWGILAVSELPMLWSKRTYIPGSAKYEGERPYTFQAQI